MITEIFCLTKSKNLEDMKDWLDWHINVCKFTYIHIVDNESECDLKSLCDKYENVTYERFEGFPNHYGLCNKYVKTRIWKTDWFICLDDDEYFYFDREKYNSVEDVINHFVTRHSYAHMFAVRWKWMWPKDWFAKRTCSKMLHNTESYTEEKMREIGIFDRARMCKTLVKLDGQVYYQTYDERRNAGHVPIHTKSSSAFTISGLPVFDNISLLKYKEDAFKDDDIRILHYKFTSIEEFMARKHVTICSPAHKEWLKGDDIKIFEQIEKLKMEA